ncbi:MAG TPA: hypothetical protein VJU87_09725 [Gemmatimonadaceae bacterium]|nr:hypothetical protein [Gemmatimonadaceae bacterium]
MSIQTAAETTASSRTPGPPGPVVDRHYLGVIWLGILIITILLLSARRPWRRRRSDRDSP